MRKIYLLNLIILLTACNRGSNKNIIEIRQKIHHDDFEYSVSDYTVTRNLVNNADTLKSEGIFYLIRFKVENNALRVGHKWDNSIGYIVDENGRKYENIQRLQQFFENSHPFGYKENYNTPAGSTDSTFLAFDLPLTVKKPYFKVRSETLMGDIFDRARFRKMMIRLF